mgnify:CR=1 FL=1
MADSFAAQVRRWSDKANRNLDLVVKEAAQGVFEDLSRTQASISETGTFTVGFTPVDTSNLVNTMIATLNGGIVGHGNTGYTAAIVGMEMGDVVTFAYTAEYAPPIEYGTDDFPGRFMVREAINGGGGWQGRMDSAAAKFRD